MMSYPVEDILGFTVSSEGKSFCTKAVVNWIQQSGANPACHWLACLNPHSCVLSLGDAHFSQALRTADWLIPDGTGIVLASVLLGGGIRERVTGSDIFFGVQTELNRSGGYSVFFLGATEATLVEIRRRMAQDYPSLRVAGTYSPPFKAEFSAADNQAMLVAINAARPDVLWVGLTAPKQEKWLHQHKAQLHVRFAAGVGAVFDFYTGRVNRSPPLFQRMGLEWLPRLLQQPRRLWRRMGVSAPIFLWQVMRQRFRQSGRR
ncbi:WecB/TagA/CpsF family glycosyltransferase [Lamprocystis purpurea]|uniref:WecB/TagA/CpsF family glycosyltransferase n=1 Tax=Lamprocystis purpurea TaxID=61598 RepID=UPI000A2F220B|nr:WecB/TagA/CpsF family glycosyltransferase [Lamprocystis purpurea]